jgi:hypothetical protein
MKDREVRRQAECAGLRPRREEIGFLARKAGVGPGEQFAPFAQQNPASRSARIAQRFAKERVGQALIAGLFRDDLERPGDQLQLVRFRLKPNLAISLTVDDPLGFPA